MEKQFGDNESTALIKFEREMLMNETANKKFDNGRRRLLLGAIAVTAASVLQAFPGRAVASTVTTPAPIPANQVNLSEFGGVPGASGTNIISAFNQAFNRLKSLGGGTLNVGAGVYNLGNMSGGTAITVNDLQNVLISAYGAQLTMNTTVVTTPMFFVFNNPNNVTIAGLAFKDFGGDVNVNWRGAICLQVQATYMRSGFKTVDCVADNVCTFLQSQQPSNPYKFEGFDIHAKIMNSYYGVNVNHNGRFSRCNVTAINVRRAFISHATRDWDITVDTNRTSGPGSNAHIVMVPFPGSPVQDVRINLKATGDLRVYNALVSICHQGSATSFAYARNVKVKVAINNASTAAEGVVTFTAEPPGTGAIQSSTISSFEQIEVSGSVVGSYNGPMVRNPSVSSASTNLVRVSDKLATYQNMSALPSYFKVFTPAGCSA